LHTSPNVIRMTKSRRIKWTRHEARMEEIRYARGDTTRTPTHRWEDNIRMHLREIRREVLDWIHLAQGRDQWWAVVNTVMKLKVP